MPAFFRQNSKYAYLALVVVIVAYGFYLRAPLFKLSGGDFELHIDSVKQLIMGISPYEFTVSSYEMLDTDPSNKGYAYFPGILYLNYSFYVLYLIIWSKTGAGPELVAYLVKIPVVISYLAIVYFFVRKYWQRDNFMLVFCVLFWMFNPYFVAKESFSPYDGIPVALALWALYYVGEDDVKAGVLYSLAVLVKTFPIILFPVFLLVAKDKIRFVVAGAVVALVASLPFMKSLHEFTTYIKGAVFVHGDRFVQGRPYLYYVAYFYKIEFFRIVPFKVYSLLSIFGGWVVASILYAKKVTHDKYILSIFPFLLFYLFTPVLNRSYILWGIPFFLVGSYNLLGRKYRWIFYALNCMYWVFCYWYLNQWKDGFHIWRPN